MEQIRVMVTGVGGGGNGEQLVKALKMSDKNYFLIGADITPISKGLFLVDKKRILPPASDPNYIETLLKVCKEEGVQALFTGSEPELKKISAVTKRTLPETLRSSKARPASRCSVPT